MDAVMPDPVEYAPYWQVTLPANPAFMEVRGAKLALSPDRPFAKRRRSAENREGPVLARGSVARPWLGRGAYGLQMITTDRELRRSDLEGVP